MPTILTTPKVTPEKVAHVQRIDGFYIDYFDKMVALTVSDYSGPEEGADRLGSNTVTTTLEAFLTDEYKVHFKFVFKAVREMARAMGILGEGVDHEPD